MSDSELTNGRRRILVDVDGVLADFAGAALSLINSRLGTSFTRSDISEWDIWRALGVKEHEGMLLDAVENNCFVKNMEPFPGAKEALDRLESEFGNVYVVTSPFDSPSWVGQRVEWLKTHMGIPLKRQVHTKSKHTVAGCCLIDDGPKNLKAWSAHWPLGLPILVDADYNKEEQNYVRVSSWDETFERIEKHFKAIEKAHH